MVRFFKTSHVFINLSASHLVGQGRVSDFLCLLSPLIAMSLPFKKRSTVAAKTIPELQRARSNGNGDGDEPTHPNYKEMQLEQLQGQAFHTLLKAFAADKSKRNSMIERLMIEWKITEEARLLLEDLVLNGLFEEQRDDDLPAFDTNTIIDAQPLPTYTKGHVGQVVPISAEKEATGMNSSGVTVASSWGGVSPQSLVGKYLQIRMPGEGCFTEYIIKEYNAEKDMHRYETANANGMEADGPLSWIDIRDIPAQDIMWEGGINPWEVLPSSGFAALGFFPGNNI